MLREKRASVSDLKNVRMRFVPTPVPNHLVSSKYTDLLNRNEELTFELTKLRMDYRLLQKRYNALILEKIAVKPELMEVSTQTVEENLMNKSTLLDFGKEKDMLEVNDFFESYFTPAKVEKTFGSRANRPESGKDPATHLKEKEISPAANRLSIALTKRLEEEKWESGERFEPTVERQAQLENKRETRARKSVIYTEPSLKVKVRKGFKFFKMREDKKDVQL